MRLLIGWAIAALSTFGGYVALGGHLAVLWQPYEGIIIVGTAIGAFLAANHRTALFNALGGFKAALRGPRYNKRSYLELTSLLYAVFKLLKSKGSLAIEAHVENPDASPIFTNFPNFMKNTEALEFFCDYMRLVTLGTESPHDLETLLDEELETMHEEKQATVDSLHTVADGVPALGIVAAVLGVIHTMGSLNEPPEVLGHLIGAALVGTFLGVLISYGFVGPLASAVKGVYDADQKYFQCMKVGILAHLSGFAPAVSVEFARKVLPSDVRPNFYEVEETVNALPPSL
ncbi:MAG: flagellar motor stator protein MotA [Alphaproteobacteria bacterium]